MAEKKLLSIAEKEIACRVAREALGYFLKNEKKIDTAYFNLSEKFNLSCGVGVSLWVSGSMRGCMISLNTMLLDGIINSVCLAARDARFESLKIEELEKTRLEIVVIQNDFTKIDLKKIKDIDTAKGYRLSYENKRGWFLPEVFNAVKYDSWEKFIPDLAFKKAELTLKEFMSAKFVLESFSVDDFIESQDQQRVFNLKGPLVDDEKLLGNEIGKELLLKKALLAGDSIVKVQNENGSLAPIAYVLEGGFSNFDWGRSAFAGWALAELGKKTNIDKYTLASQKIFAYIKKHFLNEKPVNSGPLVMAYLGQLALSLGYIDDAAQYAEKIKQTKKIMFESIMFQQLASFLLRMSYYQKNLLQTALYFAETARRNFEESIKRSELSVSLAGQAELIGCYCELYRITNRREFLEFAKKVGDWLLEKQLATGGFADTTKSKFTYTRGTTKIVEVLVLLEKILKDLQDQNAEKYTRAIEKAYEWILPMQYDEENSFFIKERMRSRILGGFRHDYQNPDVWIDAASHFIVSVLRWQFPLEKKTRVLLEEEMFYPLWQAPFMLQKSSPKMKKKQMFFRRKFLAERFSYNIAKSIADFFTQKWKLLPDIKNLLGEENEYLRNYSYAFAYLQQNKVISDKSFADLLRYVFMEKNPGFFTANLSANYPKGITDGNVKNVRWSRGFTSDWRKCLGQVFGELLERYFNGIYLKKNLLKASASQLKDSGEKYLSPQLWDNFSPRQKAVFPDRKWNDQSVFCWEKVQKYSTGEAFYAPAQLVYRNYQCAKGEPFLRESNTSGLGGFFTREGAILSALYEVIQRDAFFYYWFKKKKPLRIKPESIPDKKFQEEYQKISLSGKELILLHLNSVSGVPVFLTIIKNTKSSGPCYSLGAGCDANPLKSLLRSYDEAWSIFYWQVEKIKGGDYPELPSNFESFVTKMDINTRILAWGNIKMKDKLDFFVVEETIDFKNITNPYPKKFENEKKELEFAIKEIEKKDPGYAVYTHFSENKILRELGYYSARVIIPDCIPMNYCEENASVIHKKLRDIEEVNTIPHLFP